MNAGTPMIRRKPRAMTAPPPAPPVNPATGSALSALEHDALSEFDRSIVGDARVQYRLPLNNPVQVKKDLLLLRVAVDQALALLERPETQDRSILLAVRGLLKRANDTANAKWRGTAADNRPQKPE